MDFEIALTILVVLLACLQYVYYALGVAKQKSLRLHAEHRECRAWAVVADREAALSHRDQQLQGMATEMTKLREKLYQFPLSKIEPGFAVEREYVVSRDAHVVRIDFAPTRYNATFVIDADMATVDWAKYSAEYYAAEIAIKAHEYVIKQLMSVVKGLTVADSRSRTFFPRRVPAAKAG